MVQKELRNGALCQIDYGWQPDPLMFSARYDADRAQYFVAQAAQIAADIAGTHNQI